MCWIAGQVPKLALGDLEPPIHDLLRLPDDYYPFALVPRRSLASACSTARASARTRASPRSQAAQETVSATQDERHLQMDEKPKEQEKRAVETRQESEKKDCVTRPLRHSVKAVRGPY